MFENILTFEKGRISNFCHQSNNNFTRVTIKAVALQTMTPADAYQLQVLSSPNAPVQSGRTLNCLLLRYHMGIK